MKNVVNRRWLLTAYPEGLPSPDNWIMDTEPVPGSRTWRLAKLMTELGWTAVRVRGLTRGGYP
jgi:hypothetical protein